jgi:4-hydroxy-tetrahydrodipicolinate reductase
VDIKGRIMIRVAVSGAAGKMGSQVCRTVLEDPDLKLVAATDKTSTGSDIGSLLGLPPLDIVVTDKLEEALKASKAEVMVDFTHPQSVMANVETAIRSGVHAVVGTTGITKEHLDKIESLLKGAKCNVFIAPNFALGAVLMMQFSAMAAKYFPRVEIIELHHDQKADAPSGTAIKTAEMLKAEPFSGREEETVKGARGGVLNKVNIHSVRLPGLVAHQEVIFGGKGQTLTIRHDSIDRTSFMPGVVMAVKAVASHPGLTYGLENLLEL